MSDVTQLPRSPIPLLLGDPDLTYWEGRYWLYATNDGQEGWVNSTINAFSSTDLVEWTDHGVAYDSLAAVTWERTPSRTWAPAVLHLPGRHILYTAEDGNIAAAVADNPAGPFVDIGHPLVPADAVPGYQIDAALMRNEGRHWLLWGNSVAHMAPLDDAGTAVDLTRVHSWKPENFVEAIDLKERDGLWHATWSVGDTRKPDYHLEYATGPTPQGPWTHHGVLLEKREKEGILCTGHHSILCLPGADEWILAYHRWTMDGGAGWRREVMFAPLEFGDDGLLRKVVPTHDWYRRAL